MGDHARLSPSSAETWCLCPGSVARSEGAPDTSSYYAQEGTAAHELLETSLREMNPPSKYMGTKIAVKGNEGEDDVWFTVDDDMVDAVTVAYDYVVDFLTKNPSAKLIAERKVNPGLMMGRDDNYGTCDISLILPTKLTTLDYKHGKGIVVEANGNKQTMDYSIGALAEIPPNERALITEVETGIIQPRAAHPDGPIRTVVYSIETVYKWLMYFTTCANATDQPNAPLISGESQCRWCKGKVNADGPCPALEDKTLEVFDSVNLPAVEQQVLRNPEQLKVEEINLIDDMGDIITAFIEAVRGYKLKQMKAGVEFPGSKLVNGKQGNRKFIETDNEKTIKYLNSAFGLKKDVVTAPRELLGPAKIVALAKKAPKTNEKKITMLESRIERPKGKIVIAPTSDPRPAVMNSIEETFKDVPKQEIAQ